MKIFFTWLLLIVTLCNPVFFYYLAIIGPEWYVSNGWFQTSPDKIAHIPSFTLSVIIILVGFAVLDTIEGKIIMKEKND